MMDSQMNLSTKLSLENEDESSLARNPFIGLFPSIGDAKGYVAVTRAALTGHCSSEGQIPITNSSSTPDLRHENAQPKFASNRNWKLCEDQKMTIINDLMQRAFLLTVKPDPEYRGIKLYGGVPATCVFLRQLYEEQKNDSHEAYLTLNHMSQALMERLLMSEPVTHLTVQFDTKEARFTDETAARESHSIKYLSECYIRLSEEETSMSKSLLKDKTLLDEVLSVILKCKELVLQYSGSVLISPEVFSTNDPHNQLYKLLLGIRTVHHVSAYMYGLVDKHDKDLADLEQIFEPILHLLFEDEARLELMDPVVFPILDILSFYSQHKQLAKILLKSPHWLPSPSSQISGSLFESNTIIGRLLGLSCLPRSADAQDHFLEPSKQSEPEMEAIISNVRVQLDHLVARLHEIIYNILQDSSNVHEVLKWFGLCLYFNSNRSKMYVDPKQVAKDGFFLNLSHLLLKFCEPFLSPESKLLLKIDVRYGSVAMSAPAILSPNAQMHLVDLPKFDVMVPKPSNMPAVNAEEVQFRFTTEIFYMSHLCIKLGWANIFDGYSKLMQELSKMSAAYQDMRAQGMMDDSVTAFKNQFENKIRHQLAIKTHLLNPAVSQLVVRLAVVSSRWLVQQALAGKDYADPKPRELQRKLLPVDDVPPAVTVIPEFVPENIGDSVRFLGGFSPDALEESDEMLHCIVEFFAVFLGSSCRIKNPHLRAKLAECMAYFLPREKSGLGLSGFSGQSFRKKVFEKESVVTQILPESLLQLFVDIEFTGGSMEFYRKFSYRHYMYAILEYIWKIPAYYQTFSALYEEGKTAYKRDMVFTTFPRFITLLMNDANHMLDEALSNLMHIKEVELLKASVEWNNLSVEEKKQKESRLAEYSQLAKQYNIMAKETLNVLCYVTKDIPRPFASCCMAEGMASFLNYFLVLLAGKGRKKLRVNDFEKHNFEPAELLRMICQIYLQLGKEEQFCRLVAGDGRSYSAEVFRSTIDLLQKLGCDAGIVEEFYDLSIRLEKWKAQLSSESDMPTPPDEFMDPISCNLMLEPVQLPSSKKILDKSTISRHLLSDEKDPFNRSPLRLDQVIPLPELRQRIRDWMSENNVEIPSMTSGNCAE